MVKMYLIYCNIVNSDYQKDSGVCVYLFQINHKLLDISPKNFMLS